MISLILAVVVIFILLKIIDLAIPDGMFDKATATKNSVTDKQESEQEKIDNAISFSEVPDDSIKNTAPKGYAYVSGQVVNYTNDKYEFEITIKGYDIDGDELTYSLITYPTGGDITDWGTNTTGKFYLDHFASQYVGSFNYRATISDGLATKVITGSYTYE